MSPSVGIFASQISGHLFTLQGSYYALASVTVPSGGVSSVTFAGIPTGYSHLQIRCLSLFGSGTNIHLQFNGDTGANYGYHQLYGTGSSAAAASNQGMTYLPFMYQGGTGGTIMDILDYTNTNKNRVTRTLDGYDANGSGSIALWSGLWLSTAAINSITIFGGTFNQYSSFALYGVK
jgi:hypothetical protein